VNHEFKAASMRKSLLATISFVATLTGAEAQPITGTANQNFCQVVVVTCEEGSEDTCRPAFKGSMSSGQSFTSQTGRLCYKREKKIGDCKSGLLPYWNCATAAGHPSFLIQ
jgi:hypothetical protein